ncbi:MAG: hypothetical protein ACXVO9_11110 [Bacteroidia bacterium]
MTKGPGAENIRVLVSTQLTKVLMLYGRLNSDYNPRYLPITVNSILLIISELEMLESKFDDFAEILRENIERRERYSNVFMIPDALVNSPDTKGLRKAMQDLAAPLIKSYCVEDRIFLTTLSEQVSLKTRNTLLSRTMRHCMLLLASCRGEDLDTIEDLGNWCKSQLVASVE